MYNKFEKEVIDVNITYIDRFVEAYANYDFEGMKKTSEELIGAVIEISQNFTG